MGAPFEVRLGAAAGWVAFLGVLVLLIVFPTVVAGQPPTVHTDLNAVMAYFRHPELAVINGALAAIVGIVAIVAFGYGLRSVLVSSGDRRSHTYADLGFAILLVTAPVYLVSGALGAMLVQAADGDPGTFATLFRFYDVMYDGGADILEGAWIGAFSIAAIRSPFPRWLAFLGIVVMASRWIKAFVPFGPIPEVVIPIGGLIFVAWFLAIVVALTREARRTSPASAPA